MMYWRKQNKFYVESMDGNFEIRRSYVKQKKKLYFINFLCFVKLGKQTEKNKKSTLLKIHLNFVFWASGFGRGRTRKASCGRQSGFVNVYRGHHSGWLGVFESGTRDEKIKNSVCKRRNRNNSIWSSWTQMIDHGADNRQSDWHIKQSERFN